MNGCHDACQRLGIKTVTERVWASRKPRCISMSGCLLKGSQRSDEKETLRPYESSVGLARGHREKERGIYIRSIGRAS